MLYETRLRHSFRPLCTLPFKGIGTGLESTLLRDFKAKVNTKFRRKAYLEYKTTGSEISLRLKQSCIWLGILRGNVNPGNKSIF